MKVFQKAFAIDLSIELTPKAMERAAAMLLAFDASNDDPIEYLGLLLKAATEPQSL